MLSYTKDLIPDIGRQHLNKIKNGTNIISVCVHIFLAHSNNL